MFEATKDYLLRAMRSNRSQPVDEIINAVRALVEELEGQQDSDWSKMMGNIRAIEDPDRTEDILNDLVALYNCTELLTDRNRLHGLIAKYSIDHTVDLKPYAANDFRKYLKDSL